MFFNKLIKEDRGFSLMEMMVSIAIVSLILAVVVFNQGDFIDNFSLSTNANDLELQIRQAQVYGVSVKEFTPSSNEFTSSYGVSLNVVSAEAKLSYIFFGDRGTKNGDYDSGLTCPTDSSSECLKEIFLTRGVEINRICVIKENGQADCAPSLGRVDITFNRPDPGAVLSLFNSQGNPVGISNIIGVNVELVSPKGSNKEINIYTTGQISIQ